MTKGGMYGKVFELNDKDSTCVIETQAGKIKFDRAAISMDMSQSLNNQLLNLIRLVIISSYFTNFTNYFYSTHHTILRVHIHTAHESCVRLQIYLDKVIP